MEHRIKTSLRLHTSLYNHVMRCTHIFIIRHPLSCHTDIVNVCTKPNIQFSHIKRLRVNIKRWTLSLRQSRALERNSWRRSGLRGPPSLSHLFGFLHAVSLVSVPVSWGSERGRRAPIVGESVSAFVRLGYGLVSGSRSFHSSIFVGISCSGWEAIVEYF